MNQDILKTDVNLIEETEVVDVYTDGACLGNPGAGGWAAIIVYPDRREEVVAGGQEHTTNNRMELQAVIEVLKDLRVKFNPANLKINLYTDSMYVRDGVTKWIQVWMVKGWLTAQKQPVKNQDLWQELQELSSRCQMNWHWVRGHSGNSYNEKADKWARMHALRRKVKIGDLKESV